MLRRAAADLGDQQIAFDDRRAADAEEVLHDAELGRWCRPSRLQLAVVGSQAVEHPFGAIDVDAAVAHDGAATRAVVVAVEVFVIGRVFELPDRFTSFALQAAQPGIRSLAIELVEPAAANHGHRITRSQRKLPDQSQAILLPGS